MKNLVLLLALATAAGFTPQAVVARDASAVTPVADVTFTLKTQIHEGQLVFIGEAGAIKGQINPELKVREGAVVAITVVNGDGAMHDVAVPGFNAKSATGETLSAPQVDSVNTFDAPNTVKPKPATVKIQSGKLTIKLDPKSVTVVSIS